MDCIDQSVRQRLKYHPLIWGSSTDPPACFDAARIRSIPLWHPCRAPRLRPMLSPTPDSRTITQTCLDLPTPNIAACRRPDVRARGTLMTSVRLLRRRVAPSGAICSQLRVISFTVLRAMVDIIPRTTYTKYGIAFSTWAFRIEHSASSALPLPLITFLLSRPLKRSPPGWRVSGWQHTISFINTSCVSNPQVRSNNTTYLSLTSQHFSPTPYISH